MITAAGLPVIDGELILPRVGAWHADLVVQGSTALVVGSACPIAIDNVGTFAASVVRSGVWLDTVWARVSAGAGGATKPARALHYRNTTRRGVVQDLLRAGGEALASTSDAATLGVNLVSYTQIAQPVGQSLSALLDVRGSNRVWRQLPDGTVFIGVETWPDSGLEDLLDFQDLDERPQEGFANLGFEDVGRLLPGTLLAGRKVSTVVYAFDGGKVRARVLFED